MGIVIPCLWSSRRTSSIESSSARNCSVCLALECSSRWHACRCCAKSPRGWPAHCDKDCRSWTRRSCRDSSCRIFSCKASKWNISCKGAGVIEHCLVCAISKLICQEMLELRVIIHAGLTGVWDFLASFKSSSSCWTCVSSVASRTFAASSWCLAEDSSCNCSVSWLINTWWNDEA